ncbi:TPA: DNA (cytosine-5-)-methyltransferase [Yersinia enterocolitica]|uniref:Cytosine-specific methyltransferase n=1 Tax=Yersinia aldovae TaxID=29483 RepID=A0ABP1YRM6_YERAL|nr:MULTISPECIES: DNA (cytosine-5-)-methyltransferase [Yersinia]EKN4146355.1 DNA (cytosine-5-)-methyltransferase [Yersinia enterocolitica]EKN5927938.1 DNA (cytosine-5-)-methyltransferase [Yersinia enterocolitica]EKN6366479.1 DNA (cytosine-5-)-methyltransferase [Yersinia enterocolitica]ELZ1903467.1 DNA (cytosine-5-)-methyltransferase [Yersinia enterocolitica]MCB5326455.1 DNA (cytosine-5-)-methyltransferase [Yersinia intermedia]
MNNQNKAQYIKNLRERLGLGRTEFANLLGLSSTGERTVRGWEEEEHVPSATKWHAILEVEQQMVSYLDKAPLRQQPASESEFTFIDLFAGIGGIRLPYQQQGGHCVFSSEWDKFSQKTYLTNFGEMPHGDITKIKASDIPDHDVLLGGFPCQAFSQAGLKRGFNDTRGTMFFEIQRILAVKRPKVFMLENVKQLQGHDKGRTLKTILDILKGEGSHDIPSDIPISEDTRQALSVKLNYWVDYKVLRARDFGTPQNRERIFIVGFDKDYFDEVDFDSVFNWPKPPMWPTKVGDVLEDLSKLPALEDKYTISDKLWAGHQKRKLEHEKKGNGFGYSIFDENSEYTNTISARYYKDGSEILIDQSHQGKNPRKLTPRECARLQGFPEEYIVDAVSHGQIYKQFGNSVCMNVIHAVAEQLVKAMKTAEELISKNKNYKQTGS